MPHGITRRDFLRYSAATLNSLWLASLLPGAQGSVQSATNGQAAPLTADTSSLTQTGILGTPVDVSIGTDGVHWVLADSGALSAYDAVNEVWQPFGDGIDAVAYIPSLNANQETVQALYFFRGSEAFEAGTDAPVAIAERWPQLPPSFQSGLSGAAYAGGDIFYLFAKGQVAQITISTNQYLYGDIPSFFGNGGVGWPEDAWQGGKFDYVISGNSQSGPYLAYFVLGNEYITVDLREVAVTTAPQPLSNLYHGAALDQLTQGGNQAVLYKSPVQATDTPLQVFDGPVVYTLESAQTTTAAQATYIAQEYAKWPEAWHPILTQASVGRIGNLWSINHAGVPLRNDGSGWQQEAAASDGEAITVNAIDVGTDGAVLAASKTFMLRLGTDGKWDAAAFYPFALTDLSIGHGQFVWFINGSDKNIYGSDYEGNNFTQANTGVNATHIGANPDGTIWHCNESSQVYRYLAAGDEPSQSINLGEVTVDKIIKVASTSFGTGLFIAEKNGQIELLRYTSEYLCKSGTIYWNGESPHIAVGAASLYMFTQDLQGNASYIVALDTETGGERWRQPYAGANAYTYSPVYDPDHQLVYVFHKSDVRALSAQTGEQVWSFTLDHAIVAQPTLVQGLLLVANVQSQGANIAQALLTAINTSDAVQWAAQGQAVKERWHVAQFADAGASGSITVDPLPPVMAHGTIFYPAWVTIITKDRRLRQLNLYSINAATGKATNLEKPATSWDVGSTIPTVAPIAAQLTISPGDPKPSLVVVAPDALYGTTLDGSGEWLRYAPQGTSSITSNLAYFNGNIYFGDSSGNIYGVDAAFKPIPNLPHNAADGKAITALTVRQSDGIIIFVDESDYLSYFNPGSSTEPASVTGTVSTWQTKGRALSHVTSEGVIYTGGRRVNDVPNLGQVFGIRTNDFGDVRDFVIESQLMQDYDVGAKAVARYQTHVTVVDETKTAQPNVGLKLWADQEMTVIVAGQSHTIGPNTPLSTQADASGTLTIVSDAADLFATPLRLWASFMGPSERIVIYADETFHSRLPGMTADANNDDPTTINLATGTSYGGSTPLLTQDEATAAAKQIGAVTNAMGLGNGSQNSAALVGVGQRYKSNDEPVGYRHFSVNTPAARAVVPQASYGLSLDEANTFTAMTPAEAAARIDALEGDTEAPLGPVGGFVSDLKDAWDGIKKGATSVASAIVSVGDAVYVGLTIVVDGVKQVIRQVVHDIEDVARLIGAFFSKLIADIKEVIELLSLLLHFEEILKTYHILKPALQSAGGNLADALKSQIIPSVTSFFQNSEQEILNAFCTVKKEVDPTVACDASQRPPGATENSPAISTFGGVGSTAHTIFTVSPKSGGTATSHAVHATWGIHKVKDHYKQATMPASAAAADDPVVSFFTGFAQSLSSDPQLKQAFDETQENFAASFQVKSANEFLQMAIVDLLDILQDMLVTGEVIVEALFTQLLTLGENLVEYLIGSNGSGGILNHSIDIPIISDIFKLIIGDELTFFNLMVLVAAIPVTLIYRVVEGSWLSEQATAATGDLLTSTPLARAFGTLGAVIYAANGIFAPSADMFVVDEDGAPPILNQILTGLGVGGLIVSLSYQDEAERVNVAMQMGMIFVGYFADKIGPTAPVLLSVLGLGAIVTDIVEKVKNDVDWMGFSGDLLGEIPPLIRPIEYLAQEFPFLTTTLLASVDMVVNFGAAGAGMIDLMATWDSLTLPDPAIIGDDRQRIYLPAMAR